MAGAASSRPHLHRDGNRCRDQGIGGEREDIGRGCHKINGGSSFGEFSNRGYPENNNEIKMIIF